MKSMKIQDTEISRKRSNKKRKIPFAETRQAGIIFTMVALLLIAIPFIIWILVFLVFILFSLLGIRGGITGKILQAVYILWFIIILIIGLKETHKFSIVKVIGSLFITCLYLAVVAFFIGVIFY